MELEKKDLPSMKTRSPVKLLKKPISLNCTLMVVTQVLGREAKNQ